MALFLIKIVLAYKNHNIREAAIGVSAFDMLVVDILVVNILIASE